ncbi:Protein RALF-like 33 [Morella rubra]|uniref:Protein RALF-like 33 n=1 Tax=Morella rubra TaxID=262757 RepID=A0A6A1UQX4_9ROSI|nr:Protein RALF-like 33 [Morella rubra]
MASFFYSSAVVAICALVLVLSSLSAVHAGGSSHQLGWIPSTSPCKGTVAECLSGEEFELDSEINRRILATSSYISYGALQRNTVPCSRRGLLLQLPGWLSPTPIAAAAVLLQGAGVDFFFLFFF